MESLFGRYNYFIFVDRRFIAPIRILEHPTTPGPSGRPANQSRDACRVPLATRTPRAPHAADRRSLAVAIHPLLGRGPPQPSMSNWAIQRLRTQPPVRRAPPDAAGSQRRRTAELVASVFLTQNAPMPEREPGINEREGAEDRIFRRQAY
jgi:hypothetical protein